jgi:EAL domain-containing protein (putative c-di-GMP-specific phosphodiesterase class I)/AmiR/NasT family two-component response regulator
VASGPSAGGSVPSGSSSGSLPVAAGGRHFGVAKDLLSQAVILVVDDQDANVLLLRRVLERAGATKVIGTTDAADAINRYRDIAPDLVLLDLHMPNLDGIATLEAFGSLTPPGSYVPVVVLTADTTLEAKQQALAAGATDFLTKPFEQTEVLLRVGNLLETRALHVTLQRRNAALEAEIFESTEVRRREADQHRERLNRIEAVLASGHIEMVFQPIIDLSTSTIAGHEALARFTSEPVRPPNEWFAEAEAVGLGSELELLAVRSALDQLDELPDLTYLSVNVAPTTATRPELAEMVSPYRDRVVVELTEHDQVDQYDQLDDALDRLRGADVRIAIDDAGSGYASLRHILRLHPDIIKLDTDLTRHIHQDSSRRALAAALVVFADELGASIVAEGIETVEELDTIRGLGISCGQGYYLGRPAPLAPMPG